MAVQASRQASRGEFPADQFGDPGQLGGGRRSAATADSHAAGRSEEAAAGHCRQSSWNPPADRPPRDARSTGTAARVSGSVCGQRQAWTPSPASAPHPGVMDPIVPGRQLPIGAETDRRGQAVGEIMVMNDGAAAGGPPHGGTGAAGRVALPLHDNAGNIPTTTWVRTRRRSAA